MSAGELCSEGPPPNHEGNNPEILEMAVQGGIAVVITCHPIRKLHCLSSPYKYIHFTECSMLTKPTVPILRVDSKARILSSSFHCTWCFPSIPAVST